MDVNRYNRMSIVSPVIGQSQPEVLAEAKQGYLDDKMIDASTQQTINDLLSGESPSDNPQAEVYRLLLVAACNHYHSTKERDQEVAQEQHQRGQRNRIERRCTLKKEYISSRWYWSGKTTLTNALLDVIKGSDDRVVMIEDNLELQCSVDNLVRKLVSPPELTLTKAIFDALREYPSRIIVGEVRDKAAYDLISIWNTGHPGNICTLHSDSAVDTLERLNRLVQQAQPLFDFRPEIGRSVGAVVHLTEDCTHPTRRRVTSVIDVENFNEKWCFQEAE